MSDVTSVPYQDTFILVGGWWDTAPATYFNTMYMYQPNLGNGWRQLGVIGTGRDDVIAMTVKRSMFPECY